MLVLEGVRILDLTWQGPGPFCTMILGDLGAEIIRVGAPTAAGAPQMGRGGGQRAVAFQALNRNKKSVLLNLQSEEGRHIFHQLVKESDVIVDGFRPGVTERLGIDYQKVSKTNPRIIYCSITSYGQDGPYRDVIAHDVNAIGTAGALGLIGQKDGPPVIPLNLLADYGGGGKDAVVGILSALIAREKTGRGQYIDISLTDSTISLLTQVVLDPYFTTGVAPVRGEHFLGGSTPQYNVYQTKDGKYITIGCLEPHLWANLCREIGKEEFIAYLADRSKWDEVSSYLKQLFLTKTRDEWFEQMSPKSIFIGKVYSVDEVFNDPQVLHRQMVIEEEHPTEGRIKQVGIAIKLSDTPGKVRHLASMLGEDTEATLSGLGYSKQKINELRQQGVIN